MGLWKYLRSKETLLLLVVFVLALTLRLYQLDSLPYGLHEDEMMNGFVGRFVLLNGVDLYGNTWPLLYFNNFGDYPPILPMYLSGASTLLFGLSAFAIRLPIAVMGSIAVFAMYLLLRRVFVPVRYALIGSLFLAILPWHLMLSRATAENVTASTIFLFSLYYLFEFLLRGKLRDGVILVLLQCSTYLLYASFRILVPLTLFCAIFFAHSPIVRKKIAVLAVAFLLLTVLIGKTPWGQGRFKQTSIFYFNNTLAGRIATFGIEEGDGHVLSARVFHNKPVVYTREFIRQYLSYFSPSFLFSDGGLPHRYLTSDTGVVYISYAVCVLLAFFGFLLGKEVRGPTIWTTEGKRNFILLLLILLLSPIPAALTLDDVPNVHRSATMALLLIFPVMYFFAQLQNFSWKTLSLQSCILVCIGIEFVYFWHQYQVHVPQVQSTFRGDDRTTLAHYLVEHRADHDRIYLPNDAKPLYYLFFSNNFSSTLAGKFGPNITLQNVDNLYFTNTNCPTEEQSLQLGSRSALIDRGECQRVGPYTEKFQIKRYDGSGSFRIFSPNLSTPKPPLPGAARVR